MTDPDRLITALSERYRIERELGQGGMATVYLAEDVRHHRKVAVKVLHPELSAVIGPDRFLKEIELTAGLQHPHILPLFDSGSADGLLYYVMPYVAGESLRSRLTREKQLPIADAVRIATEVAGALDYAHRHGVVHRDIKPENILLHDGRALVADFGIALAVQQAGGSRMTQTGISLGTPHYMSPEQAMGEREITPRSDIYSLGCVSYEMLAGQPPFIGPNAQAVVAGVLTETPRPLRALRHTVPENVEAAILQALEKLPADRFGSAAEFGEALTTSGPAVTRVAPRAAPARADRRLVRVTAVLGTLLLATAGLAAWALLNRPAARVQPVIRYTLVPPSDRAPVNVAGSSLAVSPDGSRVVFLGRLRGMITLFLWNLDGGDPVPIPGTENGAFPFFSPDGESVGFLTGSQLRRVSLRGAGSSVIGEIPASVGRFAGAIWTEKDEIVYSTFSGMGRIAAEGGSHQPLTGEARNARGTPEVLPGGEEVVALIGPPGTPGQLAVIHIATGRITPLNLRGLHPVYVEPGYLAFTSSQGALQAVRFDPRRRRIIGSPRLIAQGMIVGINGIGRLGISRNGTVAYIHGSSTERQLLRVERSGLAKPLPAPSRSYWAPRISPDGRQIAVVVGPFPSPPMDIWTYDLVLGTLSRVTADSMSVNPEWSADGRRIVHPRLGEVFKVMAETPDRSAPADSLYATTSVLFEAILTRSGDTLITREVRTLATDRDLMLVPLTTGAASLWASGPGTQGEATLSPDGRWLAYTSEESGTSEVYVRPFPGPGPRYQISTGGGLSPRWNPKGGELFMISEDSLVSVPIRSVGTDLEPGRPRTLFAFHFAQMTFHAPYDVAPDGSWFVMVGSPEGLEPVSGIRIVLNWFDQPWKD